MPAHGLERGRCTCGAPACDRAGKHPWPIDGRVRSSSDPAILERWLAERPGANLAIATGASGVVVVEFDLRVVGADVSHDAMLDAYPILRDAPVVFSGGGSRHYYFRAPGDVAVGFHVGALAHAVDVLAGPALAHLPPSLHRSGRRYEWDAGLDVRALELPTLGGELLAAIVALEGGAVSTGGRSLATLPADHISRRVKIGALVKRLGYTPAGRDGRFRCFLGGHEDRDPSLSVNATLNSFLCPSHPGGPASGGLLALPQRLGLAKGVAASASFVESLFPEIRGTGDKVKL